MKVAVWVDVATWPAVIEAARARPAEDRLILLAVDDPHDLPPVLGGLMGRAHHEEGAGEITRAEAEALLEDAASALGRDCERRVLTGPTERVVTEAVDNVGMLILARDGDRSRLGPHSLGRHTRFVIDHAPCRVLLIWPENPPELGTLPPPPPH